MSQSTDQPIYVSTKFWLKVGLLLVTFIFTFSGSISSLVTTWLSRDDYSHGFLIPFISLYFVWHKRESFKYLPIQPNIPGGLILTLIGSVMLLMGHLGSVIMVQQISIIFIIPGLVLLLLGTKYLKALSLPLAYLVFMVPPIFDIIIKNIRWPFQLFTAKIASILLGLFNIPVLQNAQYIELPNITLEVADACSGINYLVSIIAIGIPLAYVTQRTWLKRVTLVTFAIVVGILANPFRVALIGVWSFNGGEHLHGPSHIFKGLFVSVTGFVFLFIGAWILARIPLADTKNSLKKENKNSNLPFNMKKFNVALLTATLVLFSIGSYLYLFNPKPVPLSTPLTEIPLTVGDWKGKDIGRLEKPLGIQGADFELIRVYRNTSGQEVNLYVGYFESQRYEKEFISWRFEKLYNNAEEIEIPTVFYGPIKVNKVVLKKSSQHYVILYWYSLNRKIVANRYKAKLITALEGFFHGTTNGAIIIVSGNLTHPDEMQKVLNDEKEFVGGLLPIIDKYLP